MEMPICNPNFLFVAIMFPRLYLTIILETMSTMTALAVPHGMFWVINPYQESDRIIAQLTQSKLKNMVDPDSIHPSIRHFYNLLKPKDFGPLIEVVLFWFGSNSQYCQ